MHVYHYAAYESATILRLAQLYGTLEKEVDTLKREGVLVDLLNVVRSTLRFSSDSLSIKAIEEAVRAQSPSALAEFRQWFAEFDSAAWDRQLETDAGSGKLDALLAEAEEDHQSAPRRSL